MVNCGLMLNLYLVDEVGKVPFINFCLISQGLLRNP